MAYDSYPPESAGVLMTLAGAAGATIGGAYLAFVARYVQSGDIHLTEPGWTGWVDLGVQIFAAFLFGLFGAALLCAGTAAMVIGINSFVLWRAAPNRRSLWRHLKEFLEDIRDNGDEHPIDISSPVGGQKPDRQPDGLVDVDRLPPEIADAIRPFLPPGTRYVTSAKLRELLAEATELLKAREAFAKQQQAAVDRQTDFDLARARAVYVAGLSEEERAVFASRMTGNGKSSL